MIQKIINKDLIVNQSQGWFENKPFPHFYIDNFFTNDVARKLEQEFPDFNSDIWHTYGNAIEVKKVCNNWNVFPQTTYAVFLYLNSPEFVEFLSNTLFDSIPFYADCGLNGGGWHIHSKGGKLNTHLDYSVHPKVFKQRKLNIIVYLNSNWKKEWGGSLGLWGNENSEKPGNLITEIEPVFNRAAVFDTTCNSWHGLPDALSCPDNEFRKSLAVYYLTDVPEGVDDRGKALFAPTEEQQDNKEVLDLIKKRSNVNTASSVYKSNK